MKSYDTPMAKCLNCKTKVNAACEPYTGDKPTKDDITVCLYCGHVMAFNEDLTLRELDDQESKQVTGVMKERISNSIQTFKRLYRYQV